MEESMCLLNVQVTPYANDELVLIVPRHHELAKQGSIALEELYSLPLVSLNQVRALILVCQWFGGKSRLLGYISSCCSMCCLTCTHLLYWTSISWGQALCYVGGRGALCSWSKRSC